MTDNLPPLPTFEEWQEIINPPAPGTQVPSIEKFVHAYARAALAQAQSCVPAGTRAVIELCQKALAEELSAWDIDPPLHHVKEAHEACSAWLAAPQTQADGMQPIDVLTSVWNAMQNSADGDDLLSKLEHMRDSIGRAIAASPQPQPVQPSNSPCACRPGMFCNNSSKCAADIRAAQAKPEQAAQPIAWHTEDHLTDRSATTYDKDMVYRWRSKGWPITPLYAEPPPPKD